MTEPAVTEAEWDVQKCDAEGCDKLGVHDRVFTITADYFGAVEVTSHFCCDHIDAMANDAPPIFDVFVSGRFRSVGD